MAPWATPAASFDVGQGPSRNISPAGLELIHGSIDHVPKQLGGIRGPLDVDEITLDLPTLSIQVPEIGRCKMEDTIRPLTLVDPDLIHQIRQGSGVMLSLDRRL